MADKEYIERGAAIGFVKKFTPNMDGWTTLNAVEVSLQNIPAADVVEVRHGEWEILLVAVIDTIGKCTNCGGEAVWRTRLKPYTLCPNCGAKMDGKDESQ